MQVAWLLGSAIAGDEQDLIQLLESRQCPACQLKDLDLTHADLRDANLKGAHLQRTNLGQARLDGTDLSNSDLSFTILQGASLRGADLRNSRLIGTDLRRADLTDALLDKNSLNQSNWIGAKGVWSSKYASFTMLELRPHNQEDGLRHLQHCNRNKTRSTIELVDED